VKKKKGRESTYNNNKKGRNFSKKEFSFEIKERERKKEQTNKP
jgi:hypothetical protein